MRVFVTGASGFIGTAVVRELLDAGHQVVGLARSDQSAATLTAVGAEAHRGDLADPESLRSGAAAADGVIHLAFIHDFANYGSAIETDRRAVEAIGAALEGTGKPFVGTSGTLMLSHGLPPGRIGTEDDAVDSGVPRGGAENAALAMAERGVRSSVIRLAPTVHGPGDHGFVHALIGIARAKGVSAYVEDGANRWPAVHRLDAARLFRLALESAPAGSRLHGVGEEGVPFREIAGVIGRHLNVPVVSIPREEAAEHFSWLGSFASTDGPTSSALTRARLGWQPEHPALLPDLEEGHYFKG
ncbi:SDR family oxidoreductase [Cohnella sp. JJ-181]|uniref:SDR family oxidoreductase n=1 Tax=Cohnella rhizoplanae TaxID=2974897 RepID=UPI0022FF5D24|nr:SDR family oxidoreductase [Cohnella sp. JJ-181]CAI6086074.1 2-alkyl-3-oxoalkanoate reductase [Cohnella sp. JJ-181]